jgi:hypothetical protein
MTPTYGAASARESQGWFLGLTGPQMTLVIAGCLPVWLAMAVGAWTGLLVWIPAWVLTIGLVCVPVRGWTAAQWLGVLVRYLVGTRTGWSHWQSRVAAGDLDQLEDADLPGVLAGVQVHDGPPLPGTACRVAVIQNHGCRTWAATARIEHPGIGLLAEDERTQMASGLAELCENASQSEMVELLAVCVRTVPDDGAARADWVRRHHSTEAPDLSVRINQTLESSLMPASVRREAFVTVVVAEDRVGRDARRAGGGVQGRARVLYGVLGEVETRLRGAIGCTRVTWLDTPGLAGAIRTGFEPGDAPGLASARIAAATDPGINARVPLAAAGPALALPTMRSYRHGDWESVTATVLLPQQGALLGALAPTLVPTRVGERRSLTVFLRPVSRHAADRSTGRDEVSAAMGREMRYRVGKVERAKQRRATQQVHDNDEKLARGRSLVRISAALSITVPAAWDVADFGRRLDASVRLCGFTPLPLDGAHDAGFAAAAIPLGTGLPRRRGRR